MKRDIITAALMALTLTVSAVEVASTPGQLSSALTGRDMSQLTITGEIDARDFRFIADSLPNLVALDLSEASIVAYTATQSPLTALVYDYPAATLPHSILMGTQLEEIKLPKNLQALGNASLAGCTALTTIEIPATVRLIDDFAFSGSALTSIVLPDSLATLGTGAFAHCYGLKTATIASGTIGDYAFLADSALNAIIMGERVTAIGAEAFHGTGLVEFDATQAAALDSIAAWALAATPITAAALPASVKHMGEGVFFGDSQLNQVALPAAVKQVRDLTFAGNSSLQLDSLLREGIDTIGAYAFYNVSAMRHMAIPASVTQLGTQAMAGMTGLEQIDIAASTPPSLGDSVWAGVDQPLVKLGTLNNEVASLYESAEQWNKFYILHDYLLYDVNGDGYVDVADVNMVVAQVLGNKPEGINLLVADANGDGHIDVADVNIIVQAVLNGGKTTVRRSKKK